MECNFYVGQKVVCVDASLDRAGLRWDNGEAPQEGAVYTIRHIQPTVSPKYFWLYFHELRRKPCQGSHGFGEPGYFHTRFRALEERKTSLSVFEEILTAVNAGKRRKIVAPEGPSRRKEHAR